MISKVVMYLNKLYDKTKYSITFLITNNNFQSVVGTKILLKYYVLHILNNKITNGNIEHDNQKYLSIMVTKLTILNP